MRTLRHALIAGFALFTLTACGDDGVSPNTHEVFGTMHVPANTAALTIQFEPWSAVEHVQVGPRTDGVPRYHVRGPVNGRIFVYAPDGLAENTPLRVDLRSPGLRGEISGTIIETANPDGEVGTDGRVRLNR